MKKLLILSRLIKLRYIKSILLLLLISDLYSLSMGQSVTVTTDQVNYAPGETVIITGMGWKRSDSVQLTLTHRAPQPNPLHSHIPRFVIPAASGEIRSEWLVTNLESGTSLELRAVGYRHGIPGKDNAGTNFMIPSITAVTVNSYSLCGGQHAAVSYTLLPDGSYDNGNIFTAQLSDPSGGFSTPVIIGNILSVHSGIIDAIIPSGTAYGTHYRIRVVSGSPVITSNSDEYEISIYPITGAPVIRTISQPTCSVSTASVELTNLPATGIWTLTRSPGGVTTTGTGTTMTITGLTAGTYTFTVTNATSCISPSSNSVVIQSQPTAPGTPVSVVDCSNGFNHAIITVTSPVSSELEYNLDAGVYRANPVFNNVVNGNHFITVRNHGGCVTIGAPFAVSCGCANPPVVLLSSASGAICGTTPFTVAGNTIGGSAGSVTITENRSGSVNPGFSSTSPFSFTYTPASADIGRTVTITVTSDNPQGAPCNSAIVTYTLTVNPMPSPPTLGTITNPTCTIERGSIVLHGLPAAGQWTLTRHPDEVSTSGSGTNTTVSGLQSGTYSFAVTNANGCTSAVSANAVINPSQSVPAAPIIGAITHPTCTNSTGSVALSGLPASETWSLIISPGGETRAGTGTTYTAANIPGGTYTFSVSNSSGCVSPPSASFVIRDQPLTPATPLAGNITSPTCSLATGSVNMTELPGDGAWTLTMYPGTITTTGTGTSRTVSGITPGTYIFTVTSHFGCVSLPSVGLVIPAPPPNPPAPVVGTVTQPTYEVPAGSAELSGLPSPGSWTLTRLQDNVTIQGSGAGYTVRGLAGGVYTYTVTNSYGCTSQESAKIIITNPVKPDLIITDPPAVCSPASVDLTSPGVTTGSTPGLTFTYWTNADATLVYSSPSIAVAGTYYIKGTTSSGFFDIKPVNAKVLDIPESNAGPDQFLAFQYNTNLSAEPGEGETGIWSIDKGEAEITDITEPNTFINNLSDGTNIFLWIVTNGVCPADTDKVQVIVGELIIPTLITPNGDTKNEYFVIVGLESLGKAELIIFDRRGSEVFINSEYDNKWNGVDYNENPLPNDTYFYILKAVNGKSYNGYIVIRR